MLKPIPPRGVPWHLIIITAIIICSLSAPMVTGQPDSEAEGDGKVFTFKDLRSPPPDYELLSLQDFRSVYLRGVVVLENHTVNRTDYYLIFSGEPAGEDDPRASEAQVKLGLATLDIGLSLPNEVFWANLNPTEPDRIVDEALATTDAGRIMLEADLQMKKDFAEYENPCEYEVARDNWKLLDKKHQELADDLFLKYPEELKDASNVRFSAVIRNWIVPGDIYASEDDAGFFIINSSLNINQEPVENYSSFSLTEIGVSDLSLNCMEDLNRSAREYGRYAAHLQETTTLPLVVRDVNQQEKYSDLRRVYTALAVAQWYKEHYDGGIPDLRNLSGSWEVTWSPEKVWEDYVVSFKEGEVVCWQTLAWNNSTVMTYNLTYNNTYNVTSDFTYDLISNSTTFSRSRGVFSDLNESSTSRREFEAYVDLGAEPLYESMQELGYSTSSSSKSYTIGGVIFSNIEDIYHPTVTKIFQDIIGGIQAVSPEYGPTDETRTHMIFVCEKHESITVCGMILSKLYVSLFKSLSTFAK